MLIKLFCQPCHNSSQITETLLLTHHHVSTRAVKQINKIKDLALEKGPVVDLKLSKNNSHVLGQLKENFGKGVLNNFLQPDWNSLQSSFGKFNLNSLGEAVLEVHDYQVWLNKKVDRNTN